MLTGANHAHYDVSFCGNLGYAPNVVAARFLAQDVAPAFERIMGRPLRLLVCGAQPTAAVKSLSSQHVDVIGDVEDIRSAYLAAPIFAAPMLVNTGLQNKLLEAMALERACLTTSRALGALGCDVGDAVATANDADAFATQIASLSQDEERRRLMGRKAHELVQKKFTWQAASHPLVALLQNQARSIR